jgi:ribosome maturation factor RimP
LQNRIPTGPVAEAVQEIAGDMGFSVVDFSAERVKGRFHVHCVLHRPGGFNLDDLGEVHSALQPRLEMLLEDDDLYIEFSSPGVERTLKSFYEFTVFVGSGVKILPVEEHDWIVGTIESADNGQCILVDETGERHTFTPDSVVKARLTD